MYVWLSLQAYLQLYTFHFYSQLTIHPQSPVVHPSVKESSSKSSLPKESISSKFSPDLSPVRDASITAELNIGKISIDTNLVIGHGSQGTTVYRYVIFCIYL